MNCVFRRQHITGGNQVGGHLDLSTAVSDSRSGVTQSVAKGAVYAYAPGTGAKVTTTQTHKFIWVEES
jgi:hypothetical protein